MLKINTDERFMKRALLLAEQGRGFTSPNPIVGACIVKNGRLIAEGYHERYGDSHAEVEALHRAGERAKGATLYVTLEPCSTWGETPPCTGAILRSGMKRVVVGALDPNPNHSGRGIRLLKRAGISVQVGVLKKEAEEQTKAFRKWIHSGIPLVILKTAQSLDGKIATPSGDSRWITGKEARVFAHRLRSQVDGIVVGKNTVLRDNPSLTVRHVPTRWQPWRFVLDTDGKLPTSAKIFRDGGNSVLVCSEQSLRQVSRKFARTKMTVLAISETKGQLDLRVLLKKLGAFGITSILVEGGGELAASFLEKNLVDQVYFMVAPKVIGGRDAKTSVEGKGVRLVRAARAVKNIRIHQLGEDIIIEGDFNSA